jgi:hypothetical protein
MRLLEISCVTCVLTAALAYGQDKPNFSGTWQLDVAKCELHNLKLADAIWAIEEADNSIHLTQNEGKSKTEMKCTTDGKDCNFSGEKAKASFWFNGPMLVEMETRGDHVTRYRLKLSDDGKTLRVETNYIVPQESAVDVLVFNKHS